MSHAADCDLDLDCTCGRAELAALLDEAGPDEVRVLLHVARRLVAVGQRQYGRLDLASDVRDYRAEAREEALDLLVYVACDAVRG